MRTMDGTGRTIGRRLGRPAALAALAACLLPLGGCRGLDLAGDLLVGLTAALAAATPGGAADPPPSLADLGGFGGGGWSDPDERCYGCNAGSGRCTGCNGTGEFVPGTDCLSCRGSGACWSCGGTGRR